MGFNRVLLVGRATHPAEPRVRDGRTGAEFPLTVERKFRTAEGQERTQRFEVPVFAAGWLGDACANRLPLDPKEIYVEGRIQVASRKTDNGEWHNSFYVTAERCEVDGAPFGLGPPRPAAQPELAGAAA